MPASHEPARKEITMSATTEAAPVKTALDPTQSQATTAEARIHWAVAHPPATTPLPVPAARKPEADIPPDPAVQRREALEQKFEAMRCRNWIPDQMVEQYQKHWQCTREAALERLLAKTGA